MRTDALVDVGRLRGLDNDTVELAGADRRRGALSREQPAIGKEDALLPPRAPPVAQQQEQAFGQHGVAVPRAFAAPDPQQHALAVDIADLQRRYLGDAQPRAIGDRPRRLVRSDEHTSELPPPMRTSYAASCSQ